MTYKIIRVYRDHYNKETIKTGLTLDEAKEHCSDPTTSGEGWMDTFTREEEE